MLFLTAYAENYVVINSDDGRDVLSGIFYANARDVPVKFMTANDNGDLFASKVGSGHDILLIQGSVPISSFLESTLVQQNTVEIYPSSNGPLTNLDLAKKSGANSFIIVDSAYADGALSALSYAALTNSYVIFTNRNNVNEVKEIVKGKNLVLFGISDNEVLTAFKEFNPTILGKGENKFDDNIIILNKTMNEFSLKNVIMTDGSVMEDSIANGNQPVLLVGRLVPTSTFNFIKQEVHNGNLKVIMLVQNHLTTTAYSMKKQIQNELQAEDVNNNLSIIVKFGQAIPSAGTGVLDIDKFYLPAYKPNLNITEVVYNQQSKNIVLSINNLGQGSAFYNTELRIRVNGKDYSVFGGNETKNIAIGEQQAKEYPFDIHSISDGTITALVVVKYGSFINSFEDFASFEGPVATINYKDVSNLSVQFAKYDSEKKLLFVTIRNNGDTAYFFSKVKLKVDGTETYLTASGTKTLDKNSIFVDQYPLELSETDITANKNITVLIDYGGRPGFLLKHEEHVVPLDLIKDGYSVLLPILLIVIIILLIYMYKRSQAGKS